MFSLCKAVCSLLYYWLLLDVFSALYFHSTLLCCCTVCTLGSFAKSNGIQSTDVNQIIPMISLSRSHFSTSVCELDLSMYQVVSSWQEAPAITAILTAQFAAGSLDSCLSVIHGLQSAVNRVFKKEKVEIWQMFFTELFLKQQTAGAEPVLQTWENLQHVVLLDVQGCFLPGGIPGGMSCSTAHSWMHVLVLILGCVLGLCIPECKISHTIWTAGRASHSSQDARMKSVHR